MSTITPAGVDVSEGLCLAVTDRYLSTLAPAGIDVSEGLRQAVPGPCVDLPCTVIADDLIWLELAVIGVLESEALRVVFSASL